MDSKFIGEAVWGTGVNFDFVHDTRVVFFAKGPSLLHFCDLMMMLIEGLDIKKKEQYKYGFEKRKIGITEKTTRPSEKKSSTIKLRDMAFNEEDQEKGEYESNLILDFVVFMDNIDNSYALGYDMLEYLCSLSKEGRIFKSVLFLENQVENLHDTFDCK